MKDNIMSTEKKVILVKDGKEKILNSESSLVEKLKSQGWKEKTSK